VNWAKVIDKAWDHNKKYFGNKWGFRNGTNVTYATPFNISNASGGGHAALGMWHKNTSHISYMSSLFRLTDGNTSNSNKADGSNDAPPPPVPLGKRGTGTGRRGPRPMDPKLLAAAKKKFVWLQGVVSAKGKGQEGGVSAPKQLVTQT
jgi:hypothetical protein